MALAIPTLSILFLLVPGMQSKGSHVGFQTSYSPGLSLPGIRWFAAAIPDQQ